MLKRRTKPKQEQRLCIGFSNSDFVSLFLTWLHHLLIVLPTIAPPSPVALSLPPASSVTAPPAPSESSLPRLPPYLSSPTAAGIIACAQLVNLHFHTREGMLKYFLSLFPRGRVPQTHMCACFLIPSAKSL